MSQSSTLPWVLVALLAGGMVWSLGRQPTQDNTPPERRPAASPEVERVAAIVRGSPAAAEIAAWLGACADVIERDSTVIQTTEHVVLGMERSATLVAQHRPDVGKLPGLSAAISEAVYAALGGRDVAELTPDKRAAAVRQLRALATACSPLGR